MERRRKPSHSSSAKGSTATEDDLAMVKAAAWAWYERGSGSETRTIRESDHLSAIPRSRRRDPKPTRYKLEAMRNSSSAQEKKQVLLTPPPLSPVSSNNDSEISVSNSLLDDYEIERISKQLDLYIESSRAEYLISSNVLRSSKNKVASLSESGTSDKRSKPQPKKKKKKKDSSAGFWPFKYTAVCGSRSEDVVRSFKVITSSRRQLRPEKDIVTVARSASSYVKS
ncbi:OLC1v1010251C1 [Oldenlandia corymbosa var. corymbosa]|uniref:OLC1v1010251C1 n=1 Tax=Oldenlandia corymbosa var. corymbosa TaxID=529605 RepID=A0AAV1DTA2_OLDCO|nr:OLC1v1010251C1 [Oldenlandia corymbosa var. corymbosa]